MPGSSKTRAKSQTESTESQTMDALNAIMEKLDSMDKRLENLEDKISGMETGLNHHVKIIEELQVDVTLMKKVLPDIQKKVEETELSVLNKSVEIQGIPSNEHESLYDIVVAIAEKANVAITPDNIDLAYRRRNKTSIVVRFIQTHYRDKLLLNFKRLSNKPTAKDIGFKSSSTRIFINEHLSFETRLLFHKAREFRKENDYKFVWTKNQHVYLRKSEDTKAIKIESTNDLKAITES
jgi:regulator of replication initiation timing